MGRVAAQAASFIAIACAARTVQADVALTAVDAWGKGIDLVRSHASIERTPPERTTEDPAPGVLGDPDALRFVLSGARTELPTNLRVTSRDRSDAEIDHVDVTLSDAPCPSGVGPVCRVTPLLRVVADDIDRNHPLVKDRSIRAEVG
ncbi:MAG: hypothetical protein ABW133_19200, partial [Polyangiaceae bacterium]